MTQKQYYIYFMSNNHGNVLYLGVTSDLAKRVYQHKTKTFKGFSQKYNVSKLVYFEQTNSVEAAILREKELKKWRREKKDNLIATLNPELKDLSEDWHEISHPLAEGSK